MAIYRWNMPYPELGSSCSYSGYAMEQLLCKSLSTIPKTRKLRLKPHSVHMNTERNTDHVLWTHLTLFTDSLAIKVQLGRTSSLSSKPPYTGICSLRSITIGCL